MSTKFIHTADWHLGRSFHGADLCGVQAEFLSWLAELAEREDVDGVIMAGDIYDRALPPVAAVSVFREGLARLADAAPLVLITGNHDSVERMGLGDLMRPEITLRAGTSRIGEPVLLGGDPSIAIYPTPYLDPLLSFRDLGLDSGDHEKVIGAALDRCREDLANRRDGTRAVAVAHAFVAGGEVSDSERKLTVGGSEQVPASIFEGFDYVALGHLHRPQAIADRVRYSGSPITYSFSEVGGAPKSVLMVEMDATQVEAREIPVPISKPVGKIEGELEELLADPALAEHEDAWLEVTLTDRDRPRGAMDRLRVRFPDVLSLRWAHDRIAESEDGAERLARLEKRDPLDLASEFVESVRGKAPAEAERELLRQALQSQNAEEAGA